MGKIFLRDLRYYINELENQYFDRKSARTKPEHILKHLVAFANTGGGQLAIGIEDKGEITGFKVDRGYSIEEFINIPILGLRETPLNVKKDIISVINVNGEEDKILILTVDVSKNRVIKSEDGNVYLRQKDKTIKLNDEQILSLKYDKGQEFFEDEIINNAKMDDIDNNLLKEYKTIMNSLELSDEEILNARNLMIDGKLTNAAILLFGKNPSRFLPQARLRVLKYNGFDAKVGQELNIIKDKTFDKSIPNIIKEMKVFIENILRDFQFLDKSGLFKIIPEYPEFAWFEGIVNALTHRDYSIRGDYIKVKIFEDKLLIESPGKLPNIVTLENIKENRYSRNPRIARILSEFGWVKELNEGVKRIYVEMDKMLLKEPEYTEPESCVRLKLENNVINRKLVFDDKLKKKIKLSYAELSEDEKKVIYYMYNTGVTVTTLDISNLVNKSRPYSRNLLKRLVDLDILKWKGNSLKDKNQFFELKIFDM